MKKLIFNTVALLSAAILSMPVVSCGGDDDDESDVPEVAGNRLSSITFLGVTFMRASYDSDGRIKEISMPDDEITISVSYSPLTLTCRDDEDTTIFSDITTNASGYITQAKISDGMEHRDMTIEYDSSGHIMSMAFSDGEYNEFTWENGNLTGVTMDEVYYKQITDYTYSSLDNRVGACSPFWEPLGPYWMTGLFGVVSAKFPSSMYTYEPGGYYGEGDYTEFAYKLNTAGYISAEQVSIDGVSLTLSYNYSAGRSDVPSVSGSPMKSFNFKTLFKSKQKI